MGTKFNMIGLFVSDLTGMVTFYREVQGQERLRSSMWRLGRSAERRTRRLTVNEGEPFFERDDCRQP